MKISLLITSIIFLSSFIYNNGFALAAQNNVSVPTVPNTINEAEMAVWKIISSLPKVLMEIGRDVFRKVESFWNTHIKSYVVSFWNKIKNFFTKKVDIKKPEVKQELEKEKQEMKIEIPKAGKNLWEKFKEIINWWRE